MRKYNENDIMERLDKIEDLLQEIYVEQLIQTEQQETLDEDIQSVSRQMDSMKTACTLEQAFCYLLTSLGNVFKCLLESWKKAL